MALKGCSKLPTAPSALIALDNQLLLLVERVGDDVSIGIE